MQEDELYNKIRDDAIATEKRIGRVMTKEEREWREAWFRFNDLNTSPVSTPKKQIKYRTVYKKITEEK